MGVREMDRFPEQWQMGLSTNKLQLVPSARPGYGHRNALHKSFFIPYSLCRLVRNCRGGFVFRPSGPVGCRFGIPVFRCLLTASSGVPGCLPGVVGGGA